MDLPGKYNIREDPLYMPFNYFWEIRCPTVKIDSTALLETVLENWIYLNIIILGHVSGLLGGFNVEECDKRLTSCLTLWNSDRYLVPNHAGKADKLISNMRKWYLHIHIYIYTHISIILYRNCWIVASLSANGRLLQIRIPRRKRAPLTKELKFLPVLAGARSASTG